MLSAPFVNTGGGGTHDTPHVGGTVGGNVYVGEAPLDRRSAIGDGTGSGRRSRRGGNHGQA